MREEGDKNTIEICLDALAREIYKRVAQEREWKPVPEGRPGRKRRDEHLAAKVTATVQTGMSKEEVGELLEELSPGQPEQRWRRDSKPQKKGLERRIDRYMQAEVEQQAKYMDPNYADSPEWRLESLRRTVRDAVNAAVAEWLERQSEERNDGPAVSDEDGRG